MNWLLILKGVIVGIGVSMPLGPMAMMVVQRTLNKGRRYGLLSGVGVGVADIIFSIFAVFGLSVIINFILQYQDVFKFAGALVLFFIGVRIFLIHPNRIKKDMLANGNDEKPLSIITSMALLTFSSPVSILLVMGAFTTMGVVKNENNTTDVMLVVLGVAIGCMIWWTLLTFVLNLLRSKVRIRHLFWINRLVGLGIVALGVFMLISIFTGDVQVAS